MYYNIDERTTNELCVLSEIMGKKINIQIWLIMSTILENRDDKDRGQN